MSQPPKKLLDQLSEHMQLKHYSPRTEESYVRWARCLPSAEDRSALRGVRHLLVLLMTRHVIDDCCTSILEACLPALKSNLWEENIGAQKE